MKFEVGMRFAFETGTEISYTIKVVKVNRNDLTVKGNNGIISHVSIEWLEYCLSSDYCELV